MSGYTENYSLTFTRENELGYTNVNAHFTCEVLDDVLTKFRDFLNAIGFTYVESLTATTEGGNKFASAD